MSVGQVLDEVEKDRAFCRDIGGRVTLSGGEPTVQAAFSGDPEGV
jgi:pyruvate-formate lyase-activating enzyme